MQDIPDLKVGDILKCEYEGDIWYELVLGEITKTNIKEIPYRHKGFVFDYGKVVNCEMFEQDKIVEICELFKE